MAAAAVTRRAVTAAVTRRTPGRSRRSSEIERSISESLSRPDPFDGDAPVERYTVTCGRDVAIATGASLACDVATDSGGTGTISVTVASDDGADYSYRGEVRSDQGSQTLEGRTASG